MKLLSLMLASLLVASCATPAQRVTAAIAVPCPPKPVLARPVLEAIPEGAAVDWAAVVVERNTIKLMAYASEASKQEGCTKR